MTRVLVTGASGFIGRPLTLALAQSGCSVRAAVRRHAGADFASGVEVVTHADLADRPDWRPLLDGIDAVVHLAGIAHSGPGIADEIYDRVNRTATADLATAAARAGVRRLVFVSSVRAQSGPTALHTLTEKDTPNPSDAYGRSKLAAEAAVAASGVPYTILRPVLIFGRGVKGNLAALARLARLPVPLPFGAFANKRSLLSLDDFIGAVRFVIETPAAAGQTFLVANPRPVSLAEIVTAIRADKGRRPSLIAMPPQVIGLALGILGKTELWDRLGGDLIVDPSRLITAGWTPASRMPESLATIVDKAAR